jgi:hypothetical protein
MALIPFILSDKANKRLFLSAVTLTILQFILFKFLYPYPDFFSDSFSYIRAANLNLNISQWPIGYSKFLLLFHHLSHSDLALITFQYFFLISATVYFFFTIRYLYQPGLLATRILFAFLFLNPLFLFLSNYVNSDPLFAALSLYWFTQLIWILNKPQFTLLFTHGVLLFLCFTVRNNAYYYPFISVLAFLFSRTPLAFKFMGVIIGATLILPFIIHTREAARQLTGRPQFSLFTGWQLANNALYIYDQIQVDSTKLPTPQCRQLDQLSRKFISTIPAKFDYRKYLQYYVGNYFIRQPNAPLKVYLSSNYAFSEDDQVESWGKASLVFSDYGSWIIKNYPHSYIQYFVLPNARNYILPPLEKLEIYNLGLDNISPSAQDWFDLKTPDVWCISKKAQGKILFIFPPLFLVLNIAFLSCLIWLFAKKKTAALSGSQQATLWLYAAFFLCNFGFTVISTINVFRYQVFPMILYLTASLMLIDILEKLPVHAHKQSVQIKNATVDI